MPVGCPPTALDASMKTSHLFLSTTAAATLLAALATPGTALALPVTGGGYSATNTSYEWTELSDLHKQPIGGSTRVLGSDDDQYTSAINLGFSFKFFNQTYSQVFITSNGLLTFGTSTKDNNKLGSGDGDKGLGDPLRFSAMPFVAVAWDDWTTTPSGTDGVYYKAAGIAGSRTFTVEWRNTQEYLFAGSPVTFEAVLHEGSNAIELRYQNMATGDSRSAFGASAVVGVRDVNAYDNGRYLQWSKNAAVLPNGAEITITPVPEPQTWALLLAGLGMVGRLSRRSGGRAAR
jgi:hypothetical protein